jgi:hypothetical protein
MLPDPDVMSPVTYTIKPRCIIAFLGRWRALPGEQLTAALLR